MSRDWEHVREIHVGERDTESVAWIDDQTTAAWTPQHVRFVFWPARDQGSAHASTEHLQAALADVMAAAEARARRSPTPARPYVPATADAETRARRSPTPARPYVPATAAPARPPRATQRALIFGVAALCACVLAVMSSRVLLAWLWSPMQDAGASSVLHDLTRSGVAAAQAPTAPLTAAAPANPLSPPLAARAPSLAAATKQSARRSWRARARPPNPPPSAADEPAPSDELEPPADPNAVTDLSFMEAPISAREARAIADGRARMGSTALNQPAPVSPNAALGTLRINSRPWALLFIDGRYVGNTPQLALRLRPGEHSVRLVNTEFGMSRVFTVELGAGETLTRIEALGDDSPPVARSSTFQGNSETQPELVLDLMP